MAPVRGFALFCDSVREETGGTRSIVGVYPDNIDVAQVPAALPKLSVYVRILVDTDLSNPGPMTIWILFPTGEEREIHTYDPKLVTSAIADAKKLGAPFAGLITHITMPQFPIAQFGRVKIVLRTVAEETVCGTLNFKKSASSSAAPGPDAALPHEGHRRTGEQADLSRWLADWQLGDDTLEKP